MAKVLVVDDEAQILTALGRGLTRVGHDVVVARTAGDGLAAAAASEPEVILLDLRLPDGDGIEVVRRLRTWTQVPILLLSGAGTDKARVAALDAGADDFVDKPFSMEELRARVGAALRRAGGNGDRSGATGNHVSGAGVNGSGTSNSANGRPGVLRCGGLTVDHVARQITVDGAPVRLTPTEWRLLETLLAHPGRLLTYGQVIAAVWSPSHGDESRASLRAHLRSLRRKLGDDAGTPRYIETEPSAGYRWIGEPDQ